MGIRSFLRRFKGVSQNHLSSAVLILALVAGGLLLGFSRIPYNSAMVDLSWPNCGRLPKEYFSKAIVGVTGGLDFHANNCAGNEASMAETYELYVNTGNPGLPKINRFNNNPLACRGSSLLICNSFNYGYHAATYALRQASMANLHSALWWLDVETDNSWTASKNANRADIYGMLEAFSAVSFLKPKIGIYTTTNQWHAIVGNWTLGLPLWLATGSTSKETAQHACLSSSVTGKPVSMTQYLSKDGTLDYDYNCQGLASTSPA